MKTILRYQNTSKATKTFYGVTFRPGETQSVPGYINVPGFIRVADLPKEPPKASKKATERPAQPEKSIMTATARPAELKNDDQQVAAESASMTAESIDNVLSPVAASDTSNKSENNT